MSETVLILDDSVEITESLAAALQRESRSILTCNDVESGQVVLERVGIDCVVLDIQLSGQFGFEGLDLITHARRHSPKCRVIVMTGKGSPDLRAEAFRRGAAGYLEKPFGVDELELLLTSSPNADVLVEPATVTHIPLIEDILSQNTLTSVFQPIVNLSGNFGSIFSFEALARFQGAPFFSNPEILFDYASRKNRLLDLELKCINQTLEQASSFEKIERLFINVHPHVISAGEQFVRRFTALADRKCFPLDRLVLEITEQSSITDPVAAIAAINSLRALGVRFALDDVGVAYSHLSLIDRIVPSFLKISQHFGTDFEIDPTKRKIVRNIVSLAGDFGCGVILEGIERSETADAARDLGIALGQGYYFARPAPAEQFRLAA